MGFFSNLFSSGRGSASNGTPKTSVAQKNSDNAVVRGNKFTFTGGGKHEHRSYNLDKASGGYREHYGGENSSSRSYNKKK